MMYLNRKSFLVFVFVGSFLLVKGQSTIDTVNIKNALGYGISNSYVQYDKNTLEWYQKEAIFPFFEKL